RQKTATATFLYQRGIVGFRLEAEQRQLETVLARCLAVAATAVAAELGEDRDNLVAEVDRQVLVHRFGLDRNLDRLVGVASDDRSGTVPDGNDAARRADANDLVVGGFVLHVAGQVLQASAVERGGEDDLLGSVAALESDFRRISGEGLDLGRLGQ